MSYLRCVCLLRVVVSNTYCVVLLLCLSSSCVLYVFYGLTYLNKQYCIVKFEKTNSNFVSIDSNVQFGWFMQFKNQCVYIVCIDIVGAIWL